MAVAVDKPPFIYDHVPVHGTRLASYFVLHTTEGLGTVESYARFFRGTPDGLGSTFLTERNGRVGMYAKLNDKTYHVANNNSRMCGMEQVGFASTSRTAWLTLYRRQIYVGAWVLAWWCDQTGHPAIVAGNSKRELTHTAGVLQHKQVPQNTHIDCGPGYPEDVVLRLANKWRHTGGPARTTRLLIATGHR